MIELLTDPQAWIALATLTALELVLGIDNVIFISILVDKLPHAQRDLARRIGLGMAMFMRIGLLLVLSWIVGLVAPLFTVLEHRHLRPRPDPDRAAACSCCGRAPARSTSRSKAKRATPPVR